MDETNERMLLYTLVHLLLSRMGGELRVEPALFHEAWRKAAVEGVSVDAIYIAGSGEAVIKLTEHAPQASSVFSDTDRAAARAMGIEL